MKEQAAQRKNLSSRRTCKLLYDALFKMLSEKPFEDISVVDLCEEAMVPRATFYNYFEDKYALLDYCIQALTADVAPSIQKKKNASPYEYVQIAADSVCDFMQKNKDALQMISRTNSKSIVFSELQKQIAHQIMALASQMGNGLVPPEILSVYYSSVIVYIAKWWLETDPPYSKEEVIHYFSLLADPGRLFKTGAS